MRCGTVCSGIGAPEVACADLDWTFSFAAEIDEFARAVYEQRHPGVPVHNDFTSIGADEYGPTDLLMGGTPCQSYSLSGSRSGLDDHRGDLALKFFELAYRKRAKWLVWENVRGVLSSKGGKDFEKIILALEKFGYGIAWRVLDAQYFGVPQRRCRLFVIGYIGDWRPAAAVLFDTKSLQRNLTKKRKARQEIAYPTGNCTSGSGKLEIAYLQKTSKTLMSQNSKNDSELETYISYRTAGDGAVHVEGDKAASLMTGTDPSTHIVDIKRPVSWDNEINASIDKFGTLTLSHHDGVLQPNVGVRRLTPIEAERLQGFPDNFTKISWKDKPPEKCPEGHRYKVIGNSMAVPVMKWLCTRIDQVDKIIN